MYSIKQFADLIGVTTTTLRNWDKSGKLKPIYLSSGHRRYTDEQLNQFKSNNSNKKINVIYCRESTKSQKSSLESQIEQCKIYCISTGLSIDKCIYDYGSGLNFKREGFLEILDLITSSKINNLILYYKDRLCRFGFELFEELSKKYNFNIIIIDKSETNKSKEKEFADDIISIIHYFSMKLYGSRSYKKQIKQAEESIESIKQEII